MADHSSPLPGFISQPTLQALVSQACTAHQFKEATYGRLVGAIGQDARFHRKQWEYVYILRALEQYGLLSADVSGIGFGCGKEPLVALMAREGVRVTATDIAPMGEADTHWGSRSVMDLFYGGICSEERFLRQVQFREVNMNQIPDALGPYDFCWSCCALEHLGSLAAGMDFIVNALNCVKPGGLAIHTTEFNVSSDTETLESSGLSLYRRIDLLRLQDRLLEDGHSLLPLNFYTGSLPEDQYVDLPPYEQKVHLKLQIQQYQVTSFGLVIRKGMGPGVAG